VNQDGSEGASGDVATVEMGAEKYDYLSRFNGNPASGLGLSWPPRQQMATAERVLQRLDELSQYFHGLEYKVAYETTSFVKASIKDGENAAGSDIAGVPGDVSVPAKLPRDADPDHCRAGGAAGDLRGALRLWLQH
jgi:hypothetical protein